MWLPVGMSGTLQVHQGKLALQCAVRLQWQLLSRFKKNLSSKILSVKTFNFLAFTTKKKFRQKTSGTNSSKLTLFVFGQVTAVLRHPSLVARLRYSEC